MRRSLWTLAATLAVLPAACGTCLGAPQPAGDVAAVDHPNDVGELIDVTWTLSSDDASGAEKPVVKGYRIERSSDDGTSWVAVGEVDAGVGRFVDARAHRRHPYRYRVVALGTDESESPPTAASDAAVAQMQLIDRKQLWFGGILFAICAAVLWFIAAARKGKQLKIRKIAGLEVVDEAVGRATEMGRSCLFVPGVMDMDYVDTVAGITVLSRVARTAAEYDARVEVPTSRSLVMTAARETVSAAYLSAGRPDAYNESSIYYVTDEQFGYVAALAGKMVRERPAACFYMGAFFAESLILAETGNSIGAIQVAGTAQPSQLPFFVAACDYTLIGEEFFAASAYLSGEPAQLGSLKGQDLGKLIGGVMLLVGCLLATWQAMAPAAPLPTKALEYLSESVLKTGGK